MLAILEASARRIVSCQSCRMIFIYIYIYIIYLTCSDRLRFHLTSVRLLVNPMPQLTVVAAGWILVTTKKTLQRSSVLTSYRDGIIHITAANGEPLPNKYIDNNNAIIVTWRIYTYRLAKSQPYYSVSVVGENFQSHSITGALSVLTLVCIIKKL